MKNILEVTRGARLYRLSFVDNEIFIENEREEAISITEKDLFDLLDDAFPLMGVVI